MGIRQAFRIDELKRNLATEKQAHKRTIQRKDKLERSIERSSMYSFYYIDAYGSRILQNLTHKQAEALTGWITTRHTGCKCSRCGYATDDLSLVRIEMTTDECICPECGGEMRLLDAPSPPEPWGNGKWVERGLDPLSSIWVGLQGAYPEFCKARWLERHGDEMINKGLRQDVKKLKKRLKQLECSHKKTEVVPEKVSFESLDTDGIYHASIMYEKCCHCGKTIRRLGEKEYYEFKIKEHEDAIEKLKSEINKKEG